ncbi:Ig domain-containing protein [Thalassospira lucentensis]|uniref:Ig domain-containing protein n=1 Tax=Thalassospira lucentensis TaxID=168935 RepID=UPI003D267518
MNISKIDFHNFLYPFLTLIFCSMLTITQANSQDYKYRYKAEGVILGEKIGIPNGPPVIGEVSAPDSYTGETYLYSFSGTDPDGDALAWSWSGNTPTGLSLNPETGEITGTPDMEGVYNFQISLSDSINGSVSTNVSIEILGCTNGPIGAVCGDGAIYTGDYNNKRYYIVTGIYGNPLTIGYSMDVCDSNSGFLPTRHESSIIYSNKDVTKIPHNPASKYWTSTKVMYQVKYYVYTMDGVITSEMAQSSDRFPYYCVRN